MYGEYRYASVSSDTRACSPIGVDILARFGGSATDAAIATILCVGVVNAHSNGIGGGHFMTIYDTPRLGSDKQLVSIIAREIAPLAANRDMFVNNSFAAQEGGLAIAVPGEIMGMYEAWRRFGRLPWADLFQPTIDLCENGFIVENALAGAIEEKEANIRADPTMTAAFVKPDGSLYQEGDLMKRPRLAATLRRIAEDPMSFYTGSLAADIVADIQENEGIITMEDMQLYHAKVKDPLVINLQNGDYTVYAPSPPSSGAVLQFILNIVDEYDFSPEDIADQSRRVLAYHRLIEAFKFAYARRSDLGDEDFVNVTELVANMTSDDYAAYIRQQINDSFTQDIDYYGPSWDVQENHGTAHTSVIAADGSAVSITSTINLYFGSKVMGSRTDIIFNDEMDDFSIPGTSNAFGVPASPSNYIAPGKRPMSSMNPFLVINSAGEVVHNSGASGGTRITTASAQVAIQNLWFGLPLPQATDTARFHHQLAPNLIYYEPHFDPTLLEALAAKGHATEYYGSIAVVGPVAYTCPSVSVAKRKSRTSSLNNCVVGVSDTRKGGAPDGY